MLGHPDKSTWAQRRHSPARLCHLPITHGRHPRASQYQSRKVLTNPEQACPSSINPLWPPPALVLQQLQELHSEHLLCFWGKLRQGTLHNPSASPASWQWSPCYSSHPWSTGLLSSWPHASHSITAHSAKVKSNFSIKQQTFNLASSLRGNCKRGA